MGFTLLKRKVIRRTLGNFAAAGDRPLVVTLDRDALTLRVWHKKKWRVPLAKLLKFAIYCDDQPLLAFLDEQRVQQGVNDNGHSHRPSRKARQAAVGEKAAPPGNKRAGRQRGA